MKTLYFDVFAGISGDMCLGAMVDLGCPVEEIQAILNQLQIPGFSLRAERVNRAALSGTQVHVELKEEHHVHRKLSDMLDIADRADWPGQVREQIETAFTLLAKAEGLVHNKPHDQIHFHEVGSYDAIVDIGGTFLALHVLGIESVRCSKIHVGEGFVKTRHGNLPLPCPATAHLLDGFVTYSTGIPYEMVTPTGAVILKTLCGESSPLPEMRLEKTAYGAGTRNTKEIANLLRVFWGEGKSTSPAQTLIIETNIDDMNPEFFAPLVEILFQHGALDVTLTPIQMKKNRPATQLSVITTPAMKEKLSKIILENSTAIGIRYVECERFCLNREFAEVETPWGTVRGKVSWGMGIGKRFSPEYEACKQLHQEHNIPMQTIFTAAIQTYHQKEGY